MERYEAYKDSGVKWLGEIPVTWTCGRIRSVYALRKELVEDGEPDELVSVSEYYGVDYRRNRISSSDVLVRADSLEGYQLCYPDDLVMNIMLAWKGAQGTSAIKGLVSPSYGVFRPLEGSCPRYYHYLMRTDQYKEYFKSYSSGIIDSRLRLYPEVFLHLNCHVPPLEEQRAIADYLDVKTAEIDALVADCEREVGLLQEYRKAVISEAVTKGLDPDAPMKDSGVEWIGEIPEGWQIARVKFLASRLSVGVVINPSTYYDDCGTVPFLKGSNIQGESFDLGDVSMITEESNKLLRKTQIHTGDVVMVRVGDPGRSVVVPPELDGANVASMLEVTCNDTVIPEYLCRVFNSHLSALQVGLYTYGAAMKQINVSDLAEFYIPVPESIEEQERMVVDLSKKTAEIDSLIEAKQEMADKLREYRKSLVSEAVTGKFKVPGV